MRQYLIFMAILMSGFLVGCKVVDGLVQTGDGLVRAVASGAVSLVDVVATDEEMSLMAGGPGPEADEAAAAVAARMGFDPTDPKTQAAILGFYALLRGGEAGVKRVRKKKPVEVEDEPA